MVVGMSLIQQFARALNASEAEVIRFMSNAPNKYRVYTIPKRTSGHRVIAQPSKELKTYQRVYLDLQTLPIHDAAMAYRDGIGIKQNAIAHQSHPYLLKLDLENFFNSISDTLLWTVWEKTLPLPSNEDRATLEKLLFWCPSKKKSGSLILSVGAPTSPLISNFFMYQFDLDMSEICREKGITYTRYADDLTFSTKERNVLFKTPEIVKHRLFSYFGHAIVLNNKKTKFSSRAYNRHVTGVTITNDNKISLGRARKRYIKHLLHQASLKKLPSEDISHLQGLLSFASHIEPDFLNALKKKYSDKLIKEVVGKK